jgi:hypothetical protein
VIRAVPALPDLDVVDHWRAGGSSFAVAEAGDR